MSNLLNFQINVTGNANSVVGQISANINSLRSNINNIKLSFAQFGAYSLGFNQISQTVQGLNQSLEEMVRPGADLNASLADLSAITGQTGEGLKRIEQYARQNAKTFGGDAAQSVESYKLLLSQLSPEIAKVPEALQGMGKHVSILSKTMGGDTRAAAEVLTTAMNQYQVSTEDPIEATREMGKMMNIMAAAAKEGSAELPQIKTALEQSGMAAKMANVSFSETNAAIQVLDKAGKKGSEGGVALRNVLATLSQGRFLPEDVQTELQAAGVDINALTDKSKSLTDRLRPLQSVVNDTALITKLFGKENNNAALALISGIDTIDDLNSKITGTNTAVEQASIVMESYDERMLRIKARFDDFKISVFNATGSMLPWVSILSQSLIPIAQLMPLLLPLGSGLIWLAGNAGSAITWFKRMGTIFRLQMMFMKADLAGASMASIGFTGNIIRAGLAVLKFSTTGIWAGIKGIGAFIASLITGGAASAGFAATASLSFATFKLSAVTACRAVSVAIMSIPIVGWIAAAIAGLIALGVYFWKTSATFRAVLEGLWESFKTTFTSIWDLAKNVFGAIAKLIHGAVTFNPAMIKQGLSQGISAFADAGSQIASAYQKGYSRSLARSAYEKTEKEINEGAEKYGMDVEQFKAVRVEAKKKGLSVDEYLKQNPMSRFGEITVPGGTPTPVDPIIQGLESVTAGNVNKQVRNMSVSIGKLIERFEIHTTNIDSDKEKIKNIVSELLLQAVNDVNLAV